MSQTFRVLLVEDDDSLRVCLDEFLASHGWSVFATALPREALQVARIQRFDFSILDFHLGGTTGLELFERLAALRPLPAILMSGLASQEEAAAAERAGVFRFLRKPLQLDLLRQSVQTLIQHHFGGPLARATPARATTPQSTPQQSPGSTATAVAEHRRRRRRRSP